MGLATTAWFEVADELLVAIPDCPAGTGSGQFGWSVSSSQVNVTLHQNPSPAVALTGSLGVRQELQQTDLHPSSGSNFFAQFWISSGRGATSVREVLLAQLTGDLPNGTVTRANYALPIHLPNANRNFDITLDEYTLVGRFGFAAGSGGQSFINSFACTPADQVVDCCAETLSKLDQLISAVTRTWPSPA